VTRVSAPFTAQINHLDLTSKTINQLIAPTHYAIHSYPSGGVGWSHPKSWVVEVINDRSKENSWVEIDRRENNQDLNGQELFKHFDVQIDQMVSFVTFGSVRLAPITLEIIT
jgi:hypothetical protein